MSKLKYLHIRRTIPRGEQAVFVALVLFLCLGHFADASARQTRDLGETSHSTSLVSRPCPPCPLDFHIAMLNPPDEAGIFIGSIFIKARLSDISVRLFLNPTDGIEVLKVPKRLRGRLRKGRAVKIDLVARISPQAPRPAGLNVELHFRYPAKNAEHVFRTKLASKSLPIGVERLTLEQLRKWAAMPKGGPVFELDRCFFFAKERRRDNAN